MASYDSKTDTHTVEMWELIDYLKGLPENTKDTSYTVKIPNCKISKNYNFDIISKFLQNKRYMDYIQVYRYINLFPTQIILDDYGKMNNPNQIIDTPLFNEAEYLVIAPKIINNKNNKISLRRFFEDCKNLTYAPKLPNNVLDLSYTFFGCKSLEEVESIPETVINMKNTFSDCKRMYTVPNIPNSVTNMEETFFACNRLRKIPNIPNSVTNMKETFAACVALYQINLTGCTVDFSKVNMKRCFTNCPALKEFIYDVKYKETKNWTLYLLKRIGSNLNIKRYNLSNNTLIDEHTISLDNAGNELDLFSKSDELLIDSVGNITDEQIKLLLESRMEFGDKYSLDPHKKWLVVWADNPDNVRSNCFVTQRELQELKDKLKTYHPDLF